MTDLVCKMLILYSSLRIKKHNPLKNLAPEFLIQGQSYLRQYINHTVGAQQLEIQRGRFLGFWDNSFKGVRGTFQKMYGVGVGRSSIFWFYSIFMIKFNKFPLSHVSNDENVIEIFSSDVSFMLKIFPTLLLNNNSKTFLSINWQTVFKK